MLPAFDERAHPTTARRTSDALWVWSRANRWYHSEHSDEIALIFGTGMHKDLGEMRPQRGNHPPAFGRDLFRLLPS